MAITCLIKLQGFLRLRSLWKMPNSTISLGNKKKTNIWIIRKHPNRIEFLAKLDMTVVTEAATGVLRNFPKFTGKHLCQRLFFNKVGDLRLATLFKKSLWHRYFPVNFAKFLKKTFLRNTSGRKLLLIFLCRLVLLYHHESELAFAFPETMAFHT